MAVCSRPTWDGGVTRDQFDPVHSNVISAASVALEVASFLERTESERLRLFRLHLQTTITRVSPLLLDLAAFESISLSEATALIYPPQGWPGHPVSDFAPLPIWKLLQKKAWRQVSGRRDAVRFQRMFANPGVIIRTFNDPRGRFGIRPCRTVLGFTAGIGSCVLTAFGSTAILKLGEQLPASVLASIDGYRLGDVVDHPIFAGRAYLIHRAMLDPADAMPLIAFHAKTVAYWGNWA